MFARLLESRTKSDAPIRKRPVIVLTRSQDMGNGLAENHAGVARLSHQLPPHGGSKVRPRDPSLCARRRDSSDPGRCRRRPRQHHAAGPLS